jgi:hypothetical protein
LVTDQAKPRVAVRLRAALKGERRADVLDTMRQAGGAVYEELAYAERTREQLRLDGGDLWEAPIAVSGHLLATWNAFALQTLGQGLLDADHAIGAAGTAGYLPSVTFDQAWWWLSTAATWLSQARQVRANPDYDLRSRYTLPVDPPSVDVKPCPDSHLEAILAAITPLREHAGLALFDLEKSGSPDTHTAAINWLRQLAAEADTAGEYAEGLHRYATAPNRPLQSYLEYHLKRAMVLWFHLGQLAAMPVLIRAYQRKAEAKPSPPPRPQPVVPIAPAPVPDRHGFDPWCLTDPRGRQMRERDPRAWKAISDMWAADPDPRRTLAIHAQIDAALASGYIDRLRWGRKPTYYFGCPWSSVYQVRQAIRVDNFWLSPPQQFTLDISVQPGLYFIRRILVGPFHYTKELAYNSAAS